MSTFVRFRDANFTNEEGAGKILAKIVGQSVVVGAETSHRVEEKGAGADDTVDVQVGEVIIIDDDGYALGAWSDAIENLPVTSNSSGNPRIDVVVAYIDKAVEDNSNNNSPGGLVFAIVDGTPAGAPTPPNDATIQAAVGADNPFIKLAQVEADDSFVSIVDADITDLREQLSIQSGGKKLQYNVAIDTWELEDDLTLENNKGLQGKNIGGTAQNLIRMNSSDKIEIGNGEMAWERLGETTLGVSGDVITVSGFTARKFLKIMIIVLDTGGNIGPLLTFNNDTGTSYGQQHVSNGAGATSVSRVNIACDAAGVGAVHIYMTFDVINIAAQEKIINGIIGSAGTAGASNAPDQRIITAKWINTADQITRIDITNSAAGSFDIGSQIIVLGHD